MRAVELYRESIEATQVAARCADNVVMFGSTTSKGYHFLQEDMKSGIDANRIGPNLWSALCTIYFFIGFVMASTNNLTPTMFP